MSISVSARVDDDALILASGARRSCETAATSVFASRGHLLGHPGAQDLLAELGALDGERDLVGEQAERLALGPGGRVGRQRQQPDRPPGRRQRVDEHVAAHIRMTAEPRELSRRRQHPVDLVGAERVAERGRDLQVAVVGQEHRHLPGAEHLGHHRDHGRQQLVELLVLEQQAGQLE